MSVEIQDVEMVFEGFESRERRRRRGQSLEEAVSYQLLHVAEVLGLDAIVLADDLGRPLAQAGCPELSTMLASSTMWTEFTGEAIDQTTLETIQANHPEVEQHHVVLEPVDVVDGGRVNLVALGRSDGRAVGVQHAARGIERICQQLA